MHCIIKYALPSIAPRVAAPHTPPVTAAPTTHPTPNVTAQVKAETVAPTAAHPAPRPAADPNLQASASHPRMGGIDKNKRNAILNTLIMVIECQRILVKCVTAR